jgi:hypothetical protein
MQQNLIRFAFFSHTTHTHAYSLKSIITTRLQGSPSHNVIRSLQESVPSFHSLAPIFARALQEPEQFNIRLKIFEGSPAFAIQSSNLEQLFPLTSLRPHKPIPPPPALHTYPPILPQFTTPPSQLTEPLITDDWLSPPPISTNTDFPLSPSQEFALDATNATLSTTDATNPSLPTPDPLTAL